MMVALNAPENLPVPLSFGAALKTGYAATGNLGSKGFADHTATGDAVNMAFRLESATRGLGAVARILSCHSLPLKTDSGHCAVLPGNALVTESA